MIYAKDLQKGKCFSDIFDTRRSLLYSKNGFIELF